MESSAMIQKVFKGPTGSLRHRCQKCAATGRQFIRCEGCRVVRYCSVEHQATDLPEHRTVCDDINKTIFDLAKEAQRIKNPGPDVVLPPLPIRIDFLSGVAPNARDHVCARLGFAVEKLIPLGTPDSLEEALNQIWEVKKLCDGDGMGLSHSAPAVMLRLDLDQESYEFVKWAATISSSITCIRPGRLPLMPPDVLDTGKADCFENADFLGDIYNLRLVIPVLLLKLKLVVDIISAKAARKVLPQIHIPLEIQKLVESQVVRSPLSAHFHLKTSQELSDLEEKLLRQIRALGESVSMFNKDFMFCLFEPDEQLSVTLERPSTGRHEYIPHVLQRWYAAWWETEGVLDLLVNARQHATQALEGAVEKAMKKERDYPGATSGRTAKETLEIRSMDHMWEYLPLAVEDASYLGPRSERPSAKHFRWFGKQKSEA